MRITSRLPASSAVLLLSSAALFLSSCLPGAEFNVTVRLEDETTGKPIPNALVLAGAYLTPEPPFDPPHPAVGAARAMSDAAGVVRFTRTEGMYEGEKPQDPLWKMLEARKAVVKRKIRAMDGGSILVFAPGYGLLEQPFMIQGKSDARPARAGSWLGGAKGESWLKEPMNLQAGELAKGREITIKLAKPRDPDFQFASFALDVLADAAVLVSRDTGATAREKARIYDFFKGQIEYAASVSDDPFYQRQLDKFKNPKTKEWLMLQQKMERNHDPVLQLWLAEKALELLPREYEEVKKYAFAVKDGLQMENDATLEAYHYYNPENPDTGFWNKDTALQWGAIGYPDNPRNDWDWQDALRYYRQGDKQKAYQAIGHVLYLLQNMSVPMHTHKISHSSGREAARYETYFAELAHRNNDALPPMYGEEAGSPRRLKRLRGYFDAVALRTFDDFVADGKPVSFGDYYAWHPDAEGELSRQPEDETLELMGRHVFPVEIEHGAGLLEHFYDTLHPAASVENTQTAADAQPTQDGQGSTATDADTSQATPQALSPEQMKSLRESLQNEQKKRQHQDAEKELAMLRPKLESFHQGQLSDSDGFFILWKMMVDMGILGSRETSEWQSHLREWKALQKIHPEFKAHPPMGLDEDRLAQKEVKAGKKKANEAYKEKAKNFVASDSALMGIYGYDQYAIFAYQYKLEFFALPPNLTFRHFPPPNSMGVGLFQGEERITSLDFTAGKVSLHKLGFTNPLKVMRFSHPILIIYTPWTSSVEFKKNYIWACNDFISGDGYRPANIEEAAIMRHMPRNNQGYIPWTDTSAEYKEFCGAISLDGKILFELPIAQHFPDRLFEIRASNKDATSLAIRVGEWVKVYDETEGEESGEIGNIKQIMIWTYPNNLEVFDMKDGSKIQESVDRHGLQWR